MPTLQTLRSARWITRLVLVWFALFLGVAIASPIVKPAGGQMVCTAMGGMKMVVAGEDGSISTSSSMDCPLCAPVITPPVAQTAATAQPQTGLGHVLQTLPAAHIAGLTGAPLPPRGPPALN